MNGTKNIYDKIIEEMGEDQYYKGYSTSEDDQEGEPSDENINDSIELPENELVTEEKSLQDSIRMT